MAERKLARDGPVPARPCGAWLDLDDGFLGPITIAAFVAGLLAGAYAF